MLSRAWRQRLGLTVGGACSSVRKPYSRRLQTTRPWSFLTSTSGSVASNPRRASSKSWVSPKGSAASTARWCAWVTAVASFGSGARSATGVQGLPGEVRHDLLAQHAQIVALPVEVRPAEAHPQLGRPDLGQLGDALDP